MMEARVPENQLYIGYGDTGKLLPLVKEMEDV
jgi:hypothetical protein